MHDLTVKAVEAAKLPAGSTETTLSDGGNLLLRVRATSKAWLFRFRFDGKRDKLYLGEYPAVGLAAAREKAAEHRATLAAGKNPKTEQERAKQVQAAEALAVAQGETPVTIKQLADRWSKDYLSKKHEDGGAYVMGIFERHLYPGGVDDLPLDLLRARHIKAVLDRTHAGGLTRTCGVLLANLRQMFKFATAAEWMAGDPSAALEASNWEGNSRESDRVLSDEDLVELFSKLPESTLGRRWQCAVKVVLACTTRVEETTLAERHCVSLSKREWRIPVAHQKTTQKKGKPADHVVYLSDYAVKQFRELLEMPDTTTHVFPALLVRSDDKTPRAANEKTLSHALRDRQIGTPRAGRAKDTTSLRLETGDWCSHDLRRTSGTQLGELGVDPHIVEKCLNHEIPSAVQRIYNRAQLKSEMKAAWQTLGEKLEKLEEKGLARYRQRLAEKATEGMI